MILLAGLPRSGTTWLGKIFDSHPVTLYRHEPDSFGRLDAVSIVPDVAQAGESRDILAEFARGLPYMGGVKASATLPQFPKTYLTPAQLLARRGLITVAKLGGKVFGEFRIPGSTNVGHNPGIRVVWKSIESVGRLGTILAAFPELRAIHIVRNPCAYAASVLRGERSARFTSKVPQSEDFGIFKLLSHTEQARARGLALDTFRSMTRLQRLGWMWVLFNEKAMLETAASERCITLRYEDLCADPENVVRGLFDFTGLGWNPQSESFIRSSTTRHSRSYYGIHKDPVRTVHRWRKELSASDIAQLRSVVRNSIPGRLYSRELNSGDD